MGIKNFIHSKIQLIEKGPPKDGSYYNTFRSAVNEGRMAYYLHGDYDPETNTLTGGKYSNAAHRSMVEGGKKQLDDLPGEYEEQDKRAKAMATAFLKHAHQKGYRNVESVHITNKPGDISKATGIELSQQENPSDLIAKFKNKPSDAKHEFLGASAKSSKKGKIGFHNGGVGDTGEFLNYNIEELANKKQNQFAKENGLSGVKSVRKQELKSRPDLYNHALAKAQELHTEVRDKVAELYNKMSDEDHEKLRSHVLNTFLKASDSSEGIPYVKVSGKSTPNKEASAMVEEAHDNPIYHAVKNAKKITMEPTGGAYMNVMADGKRQFAIQVKHNSTPMATSLKLIGQP